MGAVRIKYAALNTRDFECQVIHPVDLIDRNSIRRNSEPVLLWRRHRAADETAQSARLDRTRSVRRTPHSVNRVVRHWKPNGVPRAKRCDVAELHLYRIAFAVVQSDKACD